MQVVAIAAVASNGVIGDGRDIPWHLPEDFARFKRVTTGHVLLMGRATFEAIGHPLPGRTTIVITRQTDWQPPRVEDEATRVYVATSVEQALQMADEIDREKICWVAGGGEIYRQTWHRLTGLDLTEVHRTPEGTVHLPPVDPGQWREITREHNDGFDFVRHAPITRTDRLVLEPVSQRDDEAWHGLHSEWEMHRTGLRSEFTDVHPEVNLQANVDSWIQHGLGCWLVREANDSRWIGIGGLRQQLDGHLPYWNLFFQLDKSVQGRGYAVELSRAGFARLAELDPTAEVRAYLMPGDRAGTQVVERLGLYRMADHVDQWGNPHMVYSRSVPWLLNGVG